MTGIRQLAPTLAIGIALLAAGIRAEAEQTWRSHPPLREMPAASQRPLGKGPAFFADPAKGDDTNPGTEQKAWKTIAHALRQLRAGDTLYLRGGNYFEPIHIRLVGKPDAPITIRGYPGERAIINGGLREFFEAPQNAWEPVPGGAREEFRSVRAHPNIRDVVGAFGDSFVGLQTYWHHEDLAAANELWRAVGKVEIAPVYCGPGLWYDRETGRIHARLAHTHLEWPGVPNYTGETDPRKLPIVVAPFQSVPLHVDGAQHVRLQDLVICGGGYNTVVIEQGVDVDLDNVTVRCGTYGLLVRNTRGFRFHNSALYGNIPPWGSRVEASLRSDAPGARDVARLAGHALLVAGGHDEYSVYVYPFNRDWEISYSEFTDGSDGLYLAGVQNLKFHHNLLDHCHDDGIYLSSVSPYAPQELRIYQNVISRCLTAFAFGGIHPPKGNIYIYRNVIDLSNGVNYTRPTDQEPHPQMGHGKLIGDHGSPKWATLFFYQNTCIQSGADARHFIIGGASKERPRRVMNNIFAYLKRLPVFAPASPAEGDLQTDGNLYWQLNAKPAELPDFLAEFRKTRNFEDSKAGYAPGWEANSIIADPMFMQANPPDKGGRPDYRLREGSPAVGRGVTLPADWDDPCRPPDAKKPDIGALPFGSPPLDAGRKSLF